MRKRLLSIAAGLTLILVAAAVSLAVGLATGVSEVEQATAGKSKPKESGRGTLGFQITLDESVADARVTGRAYVIISRSGDREPRLQTGLRGAPLFGMDVSAVRPGTTFWLSMAQDVQSFPLASFKELPPGEYYVQAFMNVYTKFDRSDGSTVWLRMPAGDGQRPFVSPGNLYSEVVKVRLNPARAGTVKLVLDKMIPPIDPVPPGGTMQQGNPQETDHVKFLKIKSDLLTEFWGTPIYIAARVLLPYGYDASKEYPVVYQHGHYPSGTPYGFREDLGNAFSQWWADGDTPRFIVVNMRHENPYYDDSYGVNSPNLGPYGDAINHELIPAIDATYPTIPERWARTLTGGSTGGWIVLAQMAFYPDLYQGVWAFAPDSVDFRFHQLINVYSDPNAYYNESEWVKAPRPSSRTIYGDVRDTMAQENHYELAMGTKGRSGVGQWDIWQAVYGPQGADGYPAPIWNKLTGVIDPAVAQAWRPMDLRLYLEENWATVGPKVAGRMHVFVGDDDNFFLNNAVELLEQSLNARTDPAADAEFMYGRNGAHSWRPYTNPELLTIMYNAMQP